MAVRKSNVSARVESTLKRIVNESDFTHKDAYEIGAKIIARGDAEKTITAMETDSELERKIKQAEYQIVQERKTELERELRYL
ncbi:hypothetical protein [Methanobrevibacter sp.]|uniref:hypothetical protein n=1 Tax=Methanobrevibacter sp. TaxID=66852 RepID=UPI00389008B6